jgi:hypothetical protein
MRLRFPLFALSHSAQALQPGRSAFNKGIVPLCFSPHFVVPISFSVGIVFNCSDHPFFNKMAKNMPKIGKTIKTILLHPLRETLKKTAKSRNNRRGGKTHTGASEYLSATQKPRQPATVNCLPSPVVRPAHAAILRVYFPYAKI